MAKVYCYTCNDYSEFANQGKCEVCNNYHPTHNHNAHEESTEYSEPFYDGLPHNSDCFWED